MSEHYSVDSVASGLAHDLGTTFEAAVALIVDHLRNRGYGDAGLHDPIRPYVAAHICDDVRARREGKR